jgi:uncharacterized protein with HEPN domain
MSKRDDAFHIEGIEEHIVAIREYLPKTREEFLADEKTQDAVLMRLLALGEELNHLDADALESDETGDWNKIVGLRNRIAHGYYEIDPELIWNSLTDGSLEKLESAVEKLK